jgi:ankyrin repeat protein
VTELLKAGADVNAKSGNGYTALMEAVVKRNEKAVQIINLSSRAGNTPSIAVRLGWR